MANTKLYLHDATTALGGTLPGATTISVIYPTPDATAAGASTNRVMDTTIGVAQASSPAIASLASTLNGWYRRFVSPALAAQTIPSGNWTLSAAAIAGDAHGFLASQMVLALWRPGTGALVKMVQDDAGALVGTSLTTSETACSYSTSGSVGATAQAGDVLVLEMWGNASGGLAVSNTQVFYDGTTEGSTSSNAAYLLAPVDLFPVVAVSRPIRTFYSQAVNRAGTF